MPGWAGLGQGRFSTRRARGIFRYFGKPNIAKAVDPNTTSMILFDDYAILQHGKPIITVIESLYRIYFYRTTDRFYKAER